MPQNGTTGTGHSITFTHHYTQIIQNVIVIKIENTTIEYG